MAISFEEYMQELRRKLAETPPAQVDELGKLFWEHIQYGVEHFAELDDRGQQHVLKGAEAMKAAFKESLPRLPDTPEKRKAVRAVAQTDQEHYKVEDYVKALAGEPHATEPFVLDAETKCIAILQMAADLLFDVTRGGPVSGPHSFAILTMTGESINNAMVALHLVKHGYTNQAINQLRVIHEMLQKVALFAKEPQWVDLWASDKPWREIWKELSPRAVRRKLGQQGEDQIYGFFSNIAHTSFRSMQNIAYMERTATAEGEARKRITFRIGGAPFEHTVLWTYAWLMYMAMHILFEIHKCWESRLNVAECNTMVENTKMVFVDFMTTHLIPWGKRQGWDMVPLEKHIRENL